VGAVAVERRTSFEPRVACTELFAKLDDDMAALGSVLEVARSSVEDLAAWWQTGRPVVEIMGVTSAGRRMLQDSLDRVTRTLALLRGTIVATALDEGSSYAQIEALTGLRRQTWAELVAKARTACERR
jgi:hypothetical protein